jgi:hypothetical protein
MGDPVRPGKQSRKNTGMAAVGGARCKQPGMALVDLQMVEVGSSAEQVTINLNPRNNFIANDSTLRFAEPRS